MHDRVYLLPVSVSPATARAAAKQQPSSAATACGQRCATARPENLCRARHVGHREEVSRTRLSTFDWTSTIRKPGSIMALVLQTPPLGGCCQILLHWTSSASGDVCSPMIRIEYNEDAFTSCSIGLDHPGTKLHICWKSLLCDWLCTISSSNGS